jgi:hypothetical protein
MPSYEEKIGDVNREAEPYEPTPSPKAVERPVDPAAVEIFNAIVDESKPKPEPEVVLPTARDSAGKFLPGRSGNPSGRKRSKPFSNALKRIISQLGEGSLEAAAAALIAKSHTGDIAAIRELRDTLDGKLATPVGQANDLDAITVRWLQPGEEWRPAEDEEDGG